MKQTLLCIRNIKANSGYLHRLYSCLNRMASSVASSLSDQAIVYPTVDEDEVPPPPPVEVIVDSVQTDHTHL